MIITGDGSSGTRKGDTRPASSVSIRVSGVVTFVLRRIPYGTVQTNSGAGVGAAWSGRVAHVCGQDMLYISDSEYTLGIMSLPDGEFAEKI